MTRQWSPLDASGGFPSQHFYFCSRFMWMVIYRSFNWPKRDQSYLDSDTDAGASSVLWLESRRAYQIGSLHLPPLFDLLLKVWFPIQVANPIRKRSYLASTPFPFQGDGPSSLYPGRANVCLLPIQSIGVLVVLNLWCMYWLCWIFAVASIEESDWICDWKTCA